MNVRAPVRVCGLVVLLVLSAFGERRTAIERAGDPVPTWTTHRDLEHGYSIGVPESWHRATERMSRISEPRELLSLATVPLSWHETDCEAFAGAAAVGMDQRDAAVTVWERGYDPRSEWLDFPARPQRFGPGTDAEPGGPGCGEPPGTTIYSATFTDAGRHLHALVRIGPEAPATTRAEAWRILDSLRLDPGYTPSWPASG